MHWITVTLHIRLSGQRCHRVQYFTLLRSKTSNFWVTYYFGARSSNASNITLKTTRSKLPHNYMCHQCLWFGNALPFHPTTNRFWEVWRMAPEWPWTLQGQRYPTYVLLMPLSNFIRHVSAAHFSVKAILRQAQYNFVNVWHFASWKIMVILYP